MNYKDTTLNFINFFVGLVEVFLGLRFVLKLFGANVSNGFVNWVYEMSGVLLEPFRGIFPTEVLENTYALEFSTLFAMMVYAILGLVLVSFVDSFTTTKKRKK